MKTVNIGRTGIKASRIALGCMNFGGSWRQKEDAGTIMKRAMVAMECALEEGINFFDHADIYMGGHSEEVFSNIWKLKPGLRDKIILQSKCGIRFPSGQGEDTVVKYDFSKEHILNSVDGILRRLKTDYLDILLLHRPDPLVEPEEVAEAFETLNSTGKVRCFGVSNHNAMQIELLRKYLKQPLIANQIHISLDHTSIIDEGIYVNNDNAPDYVRSEGTIEYCRIHNITIQAWAPLAGGSLTGDNVDEKYKDMAALIARYAEEKGVSREAIVTAWLLRHPAGIQPIIGTRTPERIKAACQADSIELSRVEWYKLYTAVSHRRLP